MLALPSINQPPYPTDMHNQARIDYPTRFLPRRWVVMGVSGCGKSEVGLRLARRLGVAYEEGDHYHLPKSLAKMAAGIALEDADRHEWLLALQKVLRQADSGMVLSCSSLKRRYRDLLRAADSSLVFIHLDGPRALIARRMHDRTGHYMPLSLLESQFAALEPLEADEHGLRLDIYDEPHDLIEQILRHFSDIEQCTTTGDNI
jgi:gluconokinase